MQIFVYSRMAKVLASLAQYDNDDEGEVRERAILIMNSFVWQVGLVHTHVSSTQTCTFRHYVVCYFGNDLN